MAEAGTRQVTALDWVGAAVGGFALVVSFLSWRHVSGPSVDELLGSLGVKTWYTAWGSGFSAWLPMVLLVVAGALAVAPRLGVRVPAATAGWLLLAVAAVVLVVVRWATLPEPDPVLLARRNLRAEDIDTGPSIGLYLGLTAAVLSTVAGVLRLLWAVRRSAVRQSATGQPAPAPTLRAEPPTGADTVAQPPPEQPTQRAPRPRRPPWSPDQR